MEANTHPHPQPPPLMPPYQDDSDFSDSDSSAPPLSAFITFRHPGYPDTTNVMFRLLAQDGKTAGWGIHNGLALWACSIVACNIEGVLSPTRLQSPNVTSRDPSTPALHTDDLITAPEYYYYPKRFLVSMNESDLLYPVCPTFRDWKFPHRTLPQEWHDTYVYDRSTLT